MPDKSLKKRITNRLTVLLAPFIGRTAIRFIALTMRITYIGFEPYKKLIASGEGHILAFWHGRLMMMPYGYKGRGVTVLISQHRDGELIARTIEGLGIKCVRGSSTRGWLGGVKGMLKAVKAGRDLAITPDGPQGPRYKAQMGAVTIAARTGLPIIPMAFGASKKKLLNPGTALSSPNLFVRASLSAATP
ncbi:Protein of unknown function DUF374 [hydrothermal vent metagenome]|uniref:DUF374 domain-containing protein n=1 Tax=hydrothermal vent metagenome TaxID=652676 RepID=A0A3B0R003_9ZZZZ